MAPLSSPQLHVAIAGAGLMGLWHSRYAAASGAEIAAIVDPDPEARRALGARHRGAGLFADLETGMVERTIDVVHVCAPPEVHVPLATAALEAGKHVLVEKPLAGTVAETRRLVELAVENGVLLNPVHQFPFQRGVKRLRDDLDRLGKLVEVAFVTSSTGGTGWEPAERRALLYDILPHPLSLFHAVLGTSVVDVDWQMIQSSADDLDVAGERDGVLLRARISLRGRPTRNELRVVGERGTAHADLFHGFSIFETTAPSRLSKIAQPFAHGQKLLAAAGANLALRSARRAPAYPGLPELIGAFHGAVRGGARAPIADAEMIEIAEVVGWLRQRS